MKKIKATLVVALLGLLAFLMCIGQLVNAQPAEITCSIPCSNDPAGYVYNVNTNARIQGATVWLQRPDGSGRWENVPTGMAIMVPDTNPLTTDVNGQYQWDTLPGSYRIHVEAPGYYSANSIVVSVPPPVFDLNVGLTPIAATMGISVTPDAQSHLVGETANLVATVTSDGVLSGIQVAFEVISGPNAGLTATGVTNSLGQVEFSYVGTNPGMDTVRASILSGTIHEDSQIVWNGINNVIPEVPFGTLVSSIAMAIGLAGFVAVPKLRKRM